MSIFQLGKTKVFLRAGQMAELDAQRAKILGKSAKVIQKHARGCLARSRYVDMRTSSVRMQSSWRGMKLNIYSLSLKYVVRFSL